MDFPGVPKGAPDPTRAHGAWVYLLASVAAGTIMGAGHGVELALLVGTGFAGAFLCTAALAVGAGKKRGQLLVGVALAILAPVVALWMGAQPVFLAIAAGALVPAAGAVSLAARFGFLSGAPLTTGIAALVMAAPAVALAGGARAAQAIALFALLWPSFAWRSLRIAFALRAQGTWSREELRARGLREAAIAAAWTLAVAIGWPFGIA